MCCSSPPDPPDYSGVNAVTEKTAEMANDQATAQLEWAKTQHAENMGIVNRVLGVTLPAQEEQYANAVQDRARYESEFLPVEDEFIRDALEYDTPARRDREAGQAIADVRTQFEAERKNAEQRLSGYGADPSQISAGALDLNYRIAEATAAAGAGTNARTNVENIGRSLRGDVVNLGRGLPSQVASSYGQSVAAGQYAVGSQLGAASTGGALQTQPSAYMNAASNAAGVWGGNMNNSYSNQIAGFNAEQSASPWGAIGTLAGSAFGSPWAGKALGFADGGEADEEQVALPGGNVLGRGDGSGIDDRVPAMLSDGEYVIPTDVVRRKGTEFFDKLVEKHHTPADTQREQRRVNQTALPGAV